MEDQRCRGCYLPWQSCYGSARRKRNAKPRGGGGKALGKGGRGRAPPDSFDEADWEQYDFYWPAPPVLSPSPSPERAGEEVAEERAQKEETDDINKLRRAHVALVEIFGNEHARTVEAKQAIDAALDRVRAARPVHKQLEIASRRLWQVRNKIDKARVNVETAENTAARAQQVLAERRGALQDLLDDEAELRLEHRRMVSQAAAEGSLPGKGELTEDGYEDVAIPGSWWEGLGIPQQGLPMEARTPEMLALMRTLQETAGAIKARVSGEVPLDEPAAAREPGGKGAAPATPTGGKGVGSMAAAAAAAVVDLSGDDDLDMGDGEAGAGVAPTLPDEFADAGGAAEDEVEEPRLTPEGMLGTQDYHPGVQEAQQLAARLAARDGPPQVSAARARDRLAGNLASKREPGTPLQSVKEEEAPEPTGRRAAGSSRSPHRRSDGAAAPVPAHG